MSLKVANGFKVVIEFASCEWGLKLWMSLQVANGCCEYLNNMISPCTVVMANEVVVSGNDDEVLARQHLISGT